MTDRRDPEVHRMVMEWPDDAVAEIEALRAENARLRERLAEAREHVETLCGLVEYWAPDDGVPRTANERAWIASTADSAEVVTCDHFPGQTVCEWCKGTGAIDAPTSADDPSCPYCDGEGHE